MNRQILEDLRPIFYPSSVAIIGASNREGNFGRMFTQGYIEMGFENLYVIHPKEKSVLGIDAHSSVSELPDGVDLAIITSPLGTVTDIVQDCADNGIKGVIVFTSGFGEFDVKGKMLEQEIVRIARNNGMRLIGPNCLGVYCPESKSTIFSGMPKESGSVSMISHSGSLAIMLTMAAVENEVKFSKVVSCGNECDLNSVDLLEYYGQDPKTKFIISYLESIKDGPRFCRIAREISKEKPIIVWKGGTTERGAKAAASHTGAIAVSGHIWNAVANQTGIVCANSAEDLLDYIQAFYHLPLPKGRNVAIIAGPGGPAVGTSDACIHAGLELAELSAETKKSISDLIPSVGTSINNPIDLGMGSGFFSEWYTHSIEAVGNDNNVDIILIIGGSMDPDFGEKMMKSVNKVGKPAALINLPGRGDGMSKGINPSKGLAVFSDGRRAAIAMSKLADYAEMQKKL